MRFVGKNLFLTFGSTFLGLNIGFGSTPKGLRMDLENIPKVEESLKWFDEGWKLLKDAHEA